MIKCVVWDLDNTVWPGIAIEEVEGSLPEPDPRVLQIMDTLEARGIVSSVASRNDPSLGKQLLAQPALANRIVAPQVSWEPKSGAVKRIAERLNIGLDALAFVDDSPFERAEVAYMLPQVLVLSPDEIEAALDTPAFSPSNTTAEAARRAEMYRAEEHRRTAEEGFAGNRTDFLRWCEMRLSIAPATPDDLPRIVELTERTHQLNSTGRRYTSDELRERMDSNRWLVPVARLVDRFGNYGLIGAGLVDREPTDDFGFWILDFGLAEGKGVKSKIQSLPSNEVKGPKSKIDTWLAELVMLSCRVEGRGIPAALLIWIINEAKAAGMASLQAVYRVDERNLPMRLLFRQLGFEVIGKGQGDLVLAARDLSGELPPYPEWLNVDALES